ncbi:unnamed protein product [Lactuca saligna]|uniref:Uncharacterized protein n=1 Tax=Lactuca saligna TaxID=75948 RepID=A0AA35YR07_LACSI|nr:unnamed protein product [Lactuca saligna]
MFNSWIGKLHYKPVLDLLDAIKEKIMKRFDKKRNLVNTWNVTLVPIAKNHLNDITKGRPCVHAADFIAYIRDANWDKYVDPYFTIENFKVAYAFQIDPMPGQDQWAQKNGQKIYPPIIKRPPGRPRKNIIKSSDESKRRHKCPRFGDYGHRERTCQNPASQSFDQSETSTSKRSRGKDTKSHGGSGVSGST